MWTVAITLPFIALLLLSGAWADRRYSRFKEIPAHFDIAGNATRLAPRKAMVWLLPVLFSAMLLLTTVPALFISPEVRKGDPAVATFVVVLVAAVLLGSQAFVLWLTERWARSRPDG